MKIYLDNCCLNRPFDDLSNDMVRMEAEAVNFLRQFDSGSGNYTEERTKLLEGATIDEIAARIQSRKGLGGKL
ncbi:hypothetical protein HMPREF0322_05169 [Desulfitobacterium hafniense DP7]|uniref:Uncharacterized protein n=1 Tax=Desulfitobacterium hafniense DP7 TaxID=537010 RepID=G9XVY6_DESHA|nr:hypothetical protein [Desulfitobacterium hafniense]EHL04249.1 hypothetical protein HMPREF0322_05169 [Desulfitobacterium hafniense DP7]